MVQQIDESEEKEFLSREREEDDFLGDFERDYDRPGEGESEEELEGYPPGDED